MKKIIRKYWGIVLIITLLASMLMSAAPAAAGNERFSAAGVPNPPLSNQIVASDATIIKVAPNGDIFVVDNQVAPSVIWKSTNGGQSWVANTVAIAPATAVVADLAISPSYATDSTVAIIVNTVPLGANNVVCMISTNGGATFAQLGGNIQAAAVERGTSIDFEPTYQSGVGQILVSTADSSTPGVLGAVYTWGTLGTLNWVAVAGLTADVVMARFSPLYPIDSTIFAVSAGAAGVVLNSKVTGLAWNTIAGYPVALESGALTGDFGSAAGIVSASIAFPSDFNASIPAARNIYVGVADGAADVDADVWRVNSTIGASTATDLNAAGAAASTGVYSVAYAGTYAAGKLYAGMLASTAVWYSSNANAAVGVLFASQTNAATGVNMAYVALSGDMVYVGTSGAESAFNVSADGGVVFYQYGLIDTAAFATIAKFVPATASEWYMVTTAAGGTAADLEALWRTMDGGATWQRINTLNTANDLASVALSPNFATDQTMYFFQTGVVATNIQMSQDAGASWQPRAWPAALANTSGIVVFDQFTLYVLNGATNAVYKSINNGWTYTTQTLGLVASAVNQAKLDTGTGHLLAGLANGTVFASTNGLTWAQLDNVAVGAAPACVAFDADYANNGLVYAGTTVAGSGVFRWHVGDTPTSAWFNLDALAGAVADILVAPDGTLYASDATAAGAGVGLYRATTPTLGGGPVTMAVAGIAGQTRATGLTAGTYALGALAYAAGSNVIYAIDTGTVALVVLTDRIANVIVPVTSPANNAVVLNTAINVQYEPITGATAYQVQWNTRNDWLGTGAIEALQVAPFYSEILGNGGVVVAGVNPPAGATIYFRVQATAPFFSPWSETMSVETQLAPAGVPNSPAIIQAGGPFDGITANGGFNVDPKPSFFWGVVVGATTYEFQLASDPAMTNLVVDATGANALGNVTAYEATSALDYSKTYYWRVRAISATSATSWSAVQAFTVMAEPVVQPTSTGGGTTPTITITNTTVPAPTITFTQPAATTTTINIPSAPATTEVGPAYIWAIIIIGAVLVIAVIVLIVRTRRSV